MAEDSITIDDVANSLVKAGDRLAAQWKAHGWDTKDPAHTSVNWQSPSISLDDILGELAFAADRVRTMNGRKLLPGEGPFAVRLKKRADAFSPQNISSDTDAVMGNILELANSVSRRIAPPAPPPPPPPKVDWEDIKDERDLLPKDLARRLRSVEAKLKTLEPRAEEVGQKIADIEAAHETAEQLPTDLAELQAQREELTAIMASAAEKADAIAHDEIRSEDTRLRIERAEKDGADRIAASLTAADNMIKRSEQALRGSTSVGLATAFEARRAALAKSGTWWTCGLVAALCVALIVGWDRVHSLKEVLNGDKSAATIWANAILALFGIGAPVWFAWLSTKQIGINFRLAEDYAFKASVSQAYEGYRAEAVEVDDTLRERLLVSALTRLEEAPSRLLSPETHSSPMAELLGNPAIRRSLEAVPGISEKILALIPTKAGVATAVIAPAAATAAVAAAISGAAQPSGADKAASD